jgi:hypothetical protein
MDFLLNFLTIYKDTKHPKNLIITILNKKRIAKNWKGHTLIILNPGNCLRPIIK